MRIYWLYLMLSTMSLANEDAALTHWSHASLHHPAGSRGSYGLLASAGYQQVSLREDESAQLAEILQASTQPKSLRSQQLQLIKGTPWPLDFGLSIRQTLDLPMQQLSAHAQLTLFEAYQWPALSFRIHRSFMRAAEAMKGEETGFSTISSQRLWGPFKVYVEGSISQQRRFIRRQSTLSLVDDPVNHTRQHLNLSTGLQAVSIFDVDAIIAYSKDQQQTDSWMIKLGLLF